MKVPKKWSDGQLIGYENALTANFGTPNEGPPNLAPDINITNFIFGTFVRATPSLCMPGIAAHKTAAYFQQK